MTENPQSKAIRFGPYRYVHYTHGAFDDMDGTPDRLEEQGELYNLAEDPDERCNLFADPDHGRIVRQAQRLLLDWLITTTRLTTSQPTASEGGERFAGKRSYPVCSDHRAPNALQIRQRPPLINYR